MTNIAARSRSSRSPTFRVGFVDSIESRGKSTLGSREEEMERHSFRAGKSSVWSFVFTSTIGENKKEKGREVHDRDSFRNVGLSSSNLIQKFGRVESMPGVYSKLVSTNH